MGVSNVGQRTNIKSNYCHHLLATGARFGASMHPNIDGYNNYCHHHHCQHERTYWQRRKGTATFPYCPLPLNADPPTKQPTDEDFEKLRSVWGLPKPSAHRGATNFLNNLWRYLLDHPYDPANPGYIYWSRCGLHIIIPNEPEFTAKLLIGGQEGWTIVSKGYHSFARQLNIYGFRRVSIQEVSNGPVEGCPQGSKIWYHAWLGRHCNDETLNRAPRHASSSKNRRSITNTISNIRRRSSLSDRQPVRGSSNAFSSNKRSTTHDERSCDEIITSEDEEEARDPSYGSRRRIAVITPQYKSKKSTGRRRYERAKPLTVDEMIAASASSRPSSASSMMSTSSSLSETNDHSKGLSLDASISTMRASDPVPIPSTAVTFPPSSFHTRAPATSTSAPVASIFQERPAYTDASASVPSLVHPCSVEGYIWNDQHKRFEQKVSAYGVDDNNNTARNYMSGYYENSPVISSSTSTSLSYSGNTNSLIPASTSATDSCMNGEYDHYFPLLHHNDNHNNVMRKLTSSPCSFFLSSTTSPSICSPLSIDDDRYYQQTSQQRPGQQQETPCPMPLQFPEMKAQHNPFIQDYSNTGNNILHSNDMLFPSASFDMSAWPLSDDNMWLEGIFF